MLGCLRASGLLFGGSDMSTPIWIIAICQLIATIAIVVAAAGLVVAIILFKRMILRFGFYEIMKVFTGNG